jgi:hypothetical protein
VAERFLHTQKLKRKLSQAWVDTVIALHGELSSITTRYSFAYIASILDPSLNQSRSLVSHDELTLYLSLYPIKKHAEASDLLLVVSRTVVER